jgi:uncharacterized protein YihD (DUF1040 family)
LTNPSNIRDSNVHQVKTIVETPDNFDYYFKIIELINNVHSREPPITEENETVGIFGDVKVPELSQLQFKQPEINQRKIIDSFQVGLANFLDLSLTPLISFLNSLSVNISANIEGNNIKIRKDLTLLKEMINAGIDKIQKKYKDDLNSELFKAEGYVDDFLDQIDGYQEEIAELLKEINIIVKEKVDTLFKEKFEGLINDFSRDFDDCQKKLIDYNGSVSINLDNLEKLENSLNSLSEQIKSVKSATLNKIKAMQKETYDVTLKKHNIVLNNLNDLNKKSHKFLTNLKAAVLILEGTKAPIFDKIDKLESEKKQLLLKIKKLEQGGNK